LFSVVLLQEKTFSKKCFAKALYKGNGEYDFLNGLELYREQKRKRSFFEKDKKSFGK
jgi:hypothetical protein